MNTRIAIVTTKQPATNPRMRKNADALAEAGYDVLVLYAFNALWADESDESTFSKSQWAHKRIGGHPKRARWSYFWTRTIRKYFEWTGNRNRSFCPRLPHYLKALSKFNPDLVIGHNPGALPILTEWKKKTGKDPLFDAEDYHSGEFETGNPEGRAVHQLEEDHLSRLRCITAASPLIGEEYQCRFPHLQITIVNNAFESSLQHPFQVVSARPLKLVWFSQVIGLDRGLTEFFHGLKPLEDEPITITLIGQCPDQVSIDLKAALTSDKHQLVVLPPMNEQDLTKELSGHHIGLALETSKTLNRRLCRTNKLYMYPLSGCITLASSTPAQDDFFQQHPQCGQIFRNPDEILQGLKPHILESSEINQSRKAAWTKGRLELNWEIESKVLKSLILQLLGK